MGKYLKSLGMSVTILLSVLGMLLITPSQGAKSAYASALPTDSLVTIAIDATGKSCVTIAKFNTNTSRPTVEQMSCPAGTIMVTTLIPLSQARLKHIPYVVPASSNASANVKQATEQRVQAMMQTESQKLLVSSKTNQIIPLTACGSNGEYGVNWDPEGGTAYSSTVLFYKSTDCSTIFFQTARIAVNYYTYCKYYWVHDLYAGNYYSMPGEPTLYTPGHLYSHNVSQSARKGYYYENWVSELASAPNCYNGYNYYVNLGPIA